MDVSIKRGVVGIIYTKLKMSTYYSASDASFNLAMDDIKKNNDCYDSISQEIFSNPQYYTIDSCNNLLLTSKGNEIYQNAIQKNPKCSNVKPNSSVNVNDMTQRYQKMVRRRQEIDQNMNMILNKDSPSNPIPTLYQETNRSISVNIMFVVLAISMVYYTVRHLKE